MSPRTVKNTKHNETTLRGISVNHSQTVLRGGRGIAINHSQTVLR